MNLSGELVGINSQILTPTGGNIGLGFAIPSNMAHQVMDQLKANGKVSRSKLGVTIQNLTADLASSMGLPDANGALVSNVEPDSAAARAGLRQGDVIVAVDGEKLADNNALRNRIAARSPDRRSRSRSCATARRRRSMPRSTPRLPTSRRVPPVRRTARAKASG